MEYERIRQNNVSKLTFYSLGFKYVCVIGRLGGSVGYASNFGSGHDLTAREFEPRVGLCADGSAQSLEPVSDSVSPPLSLSLPLPHSHSVSLKNK